MNDQDYTDLFRKARAAQDRADFSALEYGFETRMTARLAALPFAGLNPVQVIWRSAAGCAALVSVIAVWFVLAQVPTETEDDLTAFWENGQAAYDGELLN